MLAVGDGPDPDWLVDFGRLSAKTDEDPRRHPVDAREDEATRRRIRPFLRRQWYRARHPDLVRWDAPEDLHYLRHGAAEGRDPSPWFDSDWYLESNPDVAEQQLNPLLHYVVRGWREGRRPNPLFDPGWYARTHLRGTADAGAEPLLHYLRGGAERGLRPGPEFDPSWYRATYPECGDVEPLAHYLARGVRHGCLAAADDPVGWRWSPDEAGDRASRVARVVVVSGEPSTPGHRFRAEWPARSLRRAGARVVVLPHGGLGPRAGEVAEADVVLLWRTPWDAAGADLVRQARRGGARLVFDLDDLLVDHEVLLSGAIDGPRAQQIPFDWVSERVSSFRAATRSVDLATATTAPLARALADLGAQVRVMPNGYDEQALRQSLLMRRRALLRDDGVVRIGYAGGSLTHQRDLAVAAPALAQLAGDDDRVRLVLFREVVDLDELPDLDAVRERIEWRDLRPVEELPDELSRMDIALAPLEVGNPFCEAKSELKFFDAALVGTPTVASATEPFAAAMRNGDTGYVVPSPEGWFEPLRRLVGDSGLRRSMGQAAFLDVLWPFGPELRDLRYGDLAVELGLTGDPAARTLGPGDPTATDPDRAWLTGLVPTSAQVLHDTGAPSPVALLVASSEVSRLDLDPDLAALVTVVAVDATGGVAGSAETAAGLDPLVSQPYPRLVRVRPAADGPGPDPWDVATAWALCPWAVRGPVGTPALSRVVRWAATDGDDSGGGVALGSDTWGDGAVVAVRLGAWAGSGGWSGGPASLLRRARGRRLPIALV